MQTLKHPAELDGAQDMGDHRDGVPVAGRPADTTSIALEYSYRQPPPRIWQVLTSQKLWASWLFDGDALAIQAGRAFAFKAFPTPTAQPHQIIDCQYTRVDAPEVVMYRLTTVEAYPWVSEVAWTLHPEHGGTNLHYLHHGFDPGRDNHHSLQASVRQLITATVKRIDEISIRPRPNKPTSGDVEHEC